MDKRDQLLEKLSQYGPVNVSFETVNGMPTGELSKLTIFGMDVSQAGTSFDLTTDGTDITLRINGGADSGATINLTDNCFNTSLGGSLLGLERARQDLIDYKSKMDDLAANMESMIAGAGVNFFTGALSTGDFAVDPALLQNPSLIDGTLAGNVADLRDTQINPPAQSYTFEQYYSLLVTEVGGNVKVAGDMADNQAAIKDQITSLRDSVSGVSIDEELTRMIQYQYGFQACARVVTVLDDMLDLLINGLIK
jgi:flagellar hook-associated protein 1 FlgK